MFSVLFVTGVASTTFLLFLRLRAIYINNTLIVRTYFSFWLTFVGLCINAATGSYTRLIGMYCVPDDSQATAFASIAPAVIGFVYPASIYIAIAYRLYQNTQLPLDETPVGLRAKTKSLILGQHLPAFSKILFIDGQRHILIAMVASIVELVVLLAPFIPDGYRSIALSPHLVVENSMACYLFRHMRSHVTVDMTVSTLAVARRSELESVDANSVPISP